MHEELLVVSEPVKEIENGEMARLVRVEGWRKNDAVGDGTGKELARERVAFDAAGRG